MPEAGGEAADDVVVTTDPDHRRPGQSGNRGDVVAQPAESGAARRDRRREAGIDAGERQHLLRPAPLDDVEIEGPRGKRRIGRDFAAEAEGDPVGHHQDVPRARHRFRPVLAHPEQFGQGEIMLDRVAADREDPVLPDLVGDRGDQRLGPAVVPDNRTGERAPVGVDQHRALADAGDRDSRDRPARQRRANVAQSLDDDRPDFVRFVLAPGLHRVKRRRPRTDGELAPLLIERDRPDGGGPRVDADQDRFV